MPRKADDILIDTVKRQMKDKTFMELIRFYEHENEHALNEPDLKIAEIYQKRAILIAVEMADQLVRGLPKGGGSSSTIEG